MKAIIVLYISPAIAELLHLSKILKTFSLKVITAKTGNLSLCTSLPEWHLMHKAKGLFNLSGVINFHQISHPSSPDGEGVLSLWAVLSTLWNIDVEKLSWGSLACLLEAVWPWWHGAQYKIYFAKYFYYLFILLFIFFYYLLIPLV